MVKQVVVMEWGEPVVKNVIDVNYEREEVKLQAPNHFGSYWASFDKCLTQSAIDYHFICKASAEINRLSIKLTIMQSNKN